MAMRRARRQMSAQAERSGSEQGEALSEPVSDEALRPRHEPEDTGAGLLSAVLARANMQQAWKRVRSNKGAAGIDGLGIDEMSERLMWEWPAIREQLLRGTYRPQPVRRVTIPKPDEGQRELGIPTVVDRLIQQALLQVLQPLLDPTFSQHKLRFPSRSQCASGRLRGSGACRIWSARSCGRGPGEVFRPGASRHPDRPLAETRCRCRSDPAGAGISDQRHHG